MKIAVVGATGMVGSRIVDEARTRGHEVTRVARSGGPDVDVADLADASHVAQLALDHEVIVNATGPSRTGGNHQEWLAAVDTLIAHVGTTRVVVVGGAGSLRVGAGRLVDQPEFPELYRAEALSQSEALEHYRAAGERLDWTYLSPAPMLAPGERTGSYNVGRDEPAGASISAEDFAVAIVDEIELPAHRGERFTVAN